MERTRGLPEDTIMRHARHKSVTITRPDRRHGLRVESAGGTAFGHGAQGWQSWR